MDVPRLSLPSGTHSLKIRDKEGTESAEQSITIPDPITLVRPSYTPVGPNYTAQFAVTGGTPPYTVTVNDKPLLPPRGEIFTTDPVLSGTPLRVQVVDSVKCSYKSTLQHTNPPG